MLWFSTLAKYNISDNWCKGDTSEIQKRQLNIVIAFSYICYCQKIFKKVYKNVPTFKKCTILIQRGTICILQQYLQTAEFCFTLKDIAQVF